MKFDKIILATHNQGKIAEMREMLKPLGIAVHSAAELNLPDVEETGTTFEENAKLKAEQLSALSGLPCLADDSGLCVDALNGRPGVYSARYAPNRDFDKGMQMLLDELSSTKDTERKAHFSCVMAFARPDEKTQVFEGRVDGKIAQAKKGCGGFGYDPIFVPDEGDGRSFAEFDGAEKNKISHRGRALRKFLEYLQK